MTSALEDMPRYQFVTNLYQAFGLSFISVISQDVPATRFYPQSTLIEADITTAKAASEVATLIEQNNHVEQLLTGAGILSVDRREDRRLRAVRGRRAAVWLARRTGARGALGAAGARRVCVPAMRGGDGSATRASVARATTAVGRSADASAASGGAVER